MSIRFRCECGKSYQVDDKHAGRPLTCKSCGEPLTVPGIEQPKAARQPTKRSPGLPPVVAGRTQKQKKRKSQDAGEASTFEGKLSPGMIAMLVVPGVLVIGGIGYGVYRTSASSGSGGGAAAVGEVAAVKMATYESEHGNFKVDYPEDWSSEGGGGTGGTPPWAKFKSGDGLFQIRASLSGSAVGDITGAGTGMFGAEELPEDLDPVAQVHEFQKLKIEVDYGGYEETPGKKIEIPYGEGRISTFTGDEGLLGSQVKGFRVTLLDNQNQYVVIAKCPQDQWDRFSATFEKMINTISR